MNYHNYYPTDMLNGEGVRAVLFLSGCNHGCKGCYNESTWNPNSGSLFTKELEDQIIRDLQDTRIKRDGLTLSGGDPLHERNLLSVLLLIKRIRTECPGKTIWLWTGYTLKEIMEDSNLIRQSVARRVDVLVDGKFEQDKYDPSLKFRGSWNQKLYKMPEGLDITPNDIPTKAKCEKIEIKLL